MQVSVSTHNKSVIVALAFSNAVFFVELSGHIRKFIVHIGDFLNNRIITRNGLSRPKAGNLIVF